MKWIANLQGIISHIWNVETSRKVGVCEITVKFRNCVSLTCFLEIPPLLLGLFFFHFCFLVIISYKTCAQVHHYLKSVSTVSCKTSKFYAYSHPPSLYFG